MRILFLAFATFAAGLLVGSLFWPDSSRSAGAARETAADREWDRGERLDFDDEVDESPRSDGATDAADMPAGDLRALAREAAREIERIRSTGQAAAVIAGDGKVTGTVRDPAGEPVAGVVVTALPQAQPFAISVDRRRAREKSHLDRGLSDVAQEAMALEMWRRSTRRTAKTGADGRFAIDGLMESEHTLTAYHDDYDVRPLSARGRVQPDAVVDFLARPVGSVKIEARLPDGSLLDHANVRWQSGADRGNDQWTKDHDTLRLPVGPCTVKAETWTPMPLESDDVEIVVRDDAPNAPVVLQLKSRRVLSTRLVLPQGFVLPRTIEYRMRPLAGGGEDPVDPVSLLKDRSNRPGWSRTPGRAHWFDLEPGRYLVAAFLDKRKLIAHAEAEVGDGETEVDLHADGLDGLAAVTVRLLGPDGGPIPGQVSFRVVTNPQEPWRNQRADALQRDDGAWIVFLDAINPGKGDPGGAILRVGTRQGGATHPVNLRGGGTITIRLDKPALMKLRVDRYAGSGVEGALFAALRSELGADGWAAVGADGSCEMRGVQPNDYKLQLIVRRDNRNWVIYSEPVRLRAGDHERTVVVPPLHTLNVRWAGRGRPRVTLRCRDERLGPFRRDARFDRNVARFDALAAGTYEVRAGRSRKAVRVPGPEVVLE